MRIAAPLRLALLSAFLALPVGYAQDVDAGPPHLTTVGTTDAGATDAGTGPTISVVPDVEQLGTTTTEELLGKAFDAFAIGDWWALGSIAIFALTLAIKSGAASAWAVAKWPKTSKFFDDPLVGFALPVVLAGVPGALAAVWSGQPFTMGLLLGSITKTAGGTMGIFLAWKNYGERRKLKAAQTPAPAPTAPGGTP